MKPNEQALASDHFDVQFGLIFEDEEVVPFAEFSRIRGCANSFHLSLEHSP